MLWDMILDADSSTYLRFFYMMVFTMTSVGYGDIVPYTINQKILSCIFMCLAC